MKRRMSKSDEKYSAIINYDLSRKAEEIENDLLLCTCHSPIVDMIKCSPLGCKDCVYLSRCAAKIEKIVGSILN